MEIPDEMAALNHRRSMLLAKVETAFADVTRQGGTSWSEALSIAAYGSATERVDVRSLDQDGGWRAIVEDEGWIPTVGGGWAFLDAIGFRYYFVAAMVRSLLDPSQFDIASTWDVPNSDTDHWDTDHWDAARWSAFSETQLEIVREFQTLQRDAEGRSKLLGVPVGDPFVPWYANLDDAPTPVSPTDASIALTRHIEAAFRGVTRIGGTSWRETKLDDLYGMPESEIRNLYSDLDESWSDLIDDDAWDVGPGIGGFAFLDPIGFRYYLPPAMVRAIRYPWDVDFSFFLTRIDDGYLEEKCSLFDPSQMATVAAFLRHLRAFFVEACEGNPEDFWQWGWIEAYDSYWYRFDLEASSDQISSDAP